MALSNYEKNLIEDARKVGEVDKAKFPLKWAAKNYNLPEFDKLINTASDDDLENARVFLQSKGSMSTGEYNNARNEISKFIGNKKMKNTDPLFKYNEIRDPYSANTYMIKAINKRLEEQQLAREQSGVISVDKGLPPGFGRKIGKFLGGKKRKTLKHRKTLRKRTRKI